MSAFAVQMEEDRQRRIAEKAALNAKLQETHALNVRLAIIAREKREAARRAAARRAREKASRKKAATNPLQALWDANGAAIYAANQAFKTKYGKNMSAKVRRKAIKDATRNGHFNAGAYAGNLVKAATPPPPPNPYAGAADRIRAGANEIDDEKKIGYQDAPLPKKPSYVVPDMSWKRDDMRAAEKYQKNKEETIRWTDIEKMRVQRSQMMDLTDWKKFDLAHMENYLSLPKPSSGWAWNKTMHEWGDAYVSQGNRTNDCGPSNLAIVLNALTETNWDKTMVSPWRLGPIAGDGEGATPPGTFVAEFNRLAAENGLDIIATHRVHGTKEELVSELNNGNPVTIIRNYTGQVEGGSHYQTIVAYDTNTDQVYLIDPGSMYQNADPILQVREESWSDFNKQWSNPLKFTSEPSETFPDPLVSVPLLQSNQMIIYR